MPSMRGQLSSREQRSRVILWRTQQREPGTRRLLPAAESGLAQLPDRSKRKRTCNCEWFALAAVFEVREAPHGWNAAKGPYALGFDGW
jgi:hypothetical protein